MQEVTVVIPNYNGSKYLKDVLESLENQSQKLFQVIVVDNGSSDNSIEIIKNSFPWVKIISLEKNYGFCKAVNEGIKASITPYVVLLNNDTKVQENFLEEMVKGISRYKNAFSASAKLLQYKNPKLLDDGGDFYNLFGWAFARGKDKPEIKYNKEDKIFASCGGAAIYRRALFQDVGYFDENHFLYLEDIDIGYRARILGYDNYFIPSARVLHVGSGTTGSRYNELKIKYSSRNNIYMLYKNMPIFMIILNLPFLIFGFTIKFLFFLFKGYGKTYLKGIFEGFKICNKEHRIKFSLSHLKNYLKIELELFINVFRRLI